MAAAMQESQDQEVDLVALRKSLAVLSRQVEEAQVHVISTIEAKHTEFVAAADQIGELRGSVHGLQNDLCRLGKMTNEVGSHGAAPTAEGEACILALHSAVARHKELGAELEALDAAATVLTTLLGVQRRSLELDELIASGLYGDAAKMSLEVALMLTEISAPVASREPALLRAAKRQYYQRRAVLTARLEEALTQLVVFGESCSTARRSAATLSGKAVQQPVTLKQVWDALQTLDMRDRRVDQLADQAVQSLVRPLLEMAKQQPVAHRLEARITKSGQDACMWTWADVPHNDVENTQPTQLASNIITRNASKSGAVKPSARAMIPVLESLFAFAQQYWADGISEVYASLGRRLWPPVAQALLQHFDTCGGDGGEALACFEEAMLRQGLIGPKERSLSKHVQEHRYTLVEQRRVSMHAEVRAWLLEEDLTFVPVSDAGEPGSVTHLLRQPGAPSQPLRSSTSAQSPIGVLGERLKGVLEREKELLRLPDMSISTATQKFAGRMRQLVAEVVVAAEQGRLEAAQDLGKLVRELVALFAVLRPYSQGKLSGSPRCGAVFLTDCLYLAHMLMLLSCTAEQRLPVEQQQLIFFVDLVPQLRRIGETHFLAMLRHQQERLAAALEPCSFDAGLSQDRRFVAAEAALGAAAQHLKLAAQGFAASLPVQLQHEMMGVLLGVVCQNLLSKLFQMYMVEPAEINCVSALLMSGINLLRQVFAVAGLASEGPAAEELVPGWAALAVAADILGSDFSRFLGKREGLHRALTRDEVIKLMQLSWQDEALSPEEAWVVLCNASEGA